LADTARWMDATEEHPSGYLLDGVQRPEKIELVPSVGTKDRLVLMTGRDQIWLGARQCFFATTIHTDFLQTNQSATRMASVAELVQRVRNPAVHSSMGLKVLLHERILRLPLDYALILLGLPLVVNRHGRNMFVMIGAAMLTVVAFFAIKTLSGALGSSGYLLILGPVSYLRLRDVQLA
jgi:lipopolysaccharide export system permease protein